MRRKGLIVIVASLLTIAVTLCSCQNSHKEEKDNISKKKENEFYRSYFTEEEKEAGSAEFDLIENVSIEAELTPMIKYTHGLAKYYMNYYYETKDLKDIKEFKKNPTLYGKQLSEILDILSKKLNGKFDQEMAWPLEEYDPNVKIYFRAENGYNYDFYTFWRTGNKAFDNSEQLYTPSMRLKLQEGRNDCIDKEVASIIKRYVWDFSKEELLFLEDKKKTGEELKQYIEGIIGEKLCDTWECIPVCEKTMTKLKKTAKQAEVEHYSSYKNPEKDYYEYQFYYDIEGLPFVSMTLPYDLKEGETCSSMARVSVLSGSKQILGLGANPQTVCLSEDGILQLYTSKNYIEGEIYKEAAMVISPDEVLKQIKEHYEQQMIVNPIRITQIQLVYSGYFTNAEDGVIEPAICPFWVAIAYDGSANGNVEFVYDAFTGECIREAGIR